MTIKALVTAAAAAAAVLLACAATPAPAHAEAWMDVGGVQVRVANSLTVFEAGDDQFLEGLRGDLMASLRTVPALPYSTLQTIPDARLVGYGDCKTISVAMRNILIAQGFPEDALLLATADTEKGEPHMVLLIRGKWQGKEQTRVFDIRIQEITTIDRLIDHGYKFNGIQSASGPDAILLRFNGRDYL